nr:MAG TPA: hypothetical protein [Caudoviricetes sp.]
MNRKKIYLFPVAANPPKKVIHTVKDYLLGFAVASFPFLEKKINDCLN